MSDRHGLGQAVLLLRPRVPVWVTGSPEECACEDATVPLACEQGWGRPGAEVPRTSELSVAGHGVPHCPVRGRHRHKARLRSAMPVSSVRASRAWSVTSSGQRLKVVEVLRRVNLRRFSPRSRHRRHVRGTRCPSPPRRPGWTCPPPRDGDRQCLGVCAPGCQRVGPEPGGPSVPPTSAISHPERGF